MPSVAHQLQRARRFGKMAMNIGSTFHCNTRKVGMCTRLKSMIITTTMFALHTCVAQASDPRTGGESVAGDALAKGVFGAVAIVVLLGLQYLLNKIQALLDPSRKAKEPERRRGPPAPSKQDEQDAQAALERATKLMAQGKTKEALKDFTAILSFYPNTQGASMARMNVAQIEEPTHEQRNATGDPPTRSE